MWNISYGMYTITSVHVSLLQYGNPIYYDDSGNMSYYGYDIRYDEAGEPCRKEDGNIFWDPQVRGLAS